MKERPICKDCVHAKYFSQDNWLDRLEYDIRGFDGGYYCARTEYSVASGSELVTGKDKKRMISCQQERYRWFGCGLKGKHFEPKDQVE